MAADSISNPGLNPNPDLIDSDRRAGDSAGPPAAEVRAQPCRRLRSNGVFLYSDETSLDSSHEQYSSSACWCARTMTSFGPDDDMVGWLDCRNPERSCYEPLY